ncbi:putative Sin3 binding protein-domain-containing protein [Bombardia bombarda]|uniref:Sin3 binding protein-domain-containing protein n=1 Tax=Bombardia bombarda TaxID=252184 RepID=A0AA39WTD1_9PEZI|nr:putative Sin3 binding protein-domain-containing protein [Bombardia bombarda]
MPSSRLLDVFDDDDDNNNNNYTYRSHSHSPIQHRRSPITTRRRCRRIVSEPAQLEANPRSLRRTTDTCRSNQRPRSVNMATMASAVRDIAMTTSGRDNLTAVAARSVPVATTPHPAALPTPPNSLSPTIPPHGLKAQLQRARLERIDSDLDLHDGHHHRHRDHEHDHEHDHDHDGPRQHTPLGSPPYDAAGAITPAMLAKFHLPEILLNQGPLALRHIMGYLTTSVPGFAGIPPAKARRLVVGALEGRGGEGGGLNGDVEFEKVGWGRWDARRRSSQDPRSAAAARRSNSPPDGLYPTSIPISSKGVGANGGGAGSGGWPLNRSRLTAASRLSAGCDSSAAFSYDDRDHHHMMEHEADKMSMDDDGSASASCSSAPDDDDDVMMNDDPEDVTDDEDWAAVGAAALRASSYQAPNHHTFPSNRLFTPGDGAVRSCSAAVGMARPPQLFSNFDFSASQEREAVEALLRLGSV